MIIVHGTFPIKPELRDEALGAARTMADATREEPGCVSYEFYVGLSDPDTLMLFQEWQSMEALMDHFDTPHMAVFVRELPTFVNGEISTRRYEVEAVEDDGDALEDREEAIEGDAAVVDDEEARAAEDEGMDEEVSFDEVPRIIH